MPRGPRIAAPEERSREVLPSGPPLPVPHERSPRGILPILRDLGLINVAGEYGEAPPFGPEDDTPAPVPDGKDNPVVPPLPVDPGIFQTPPAPLPEGPRLDTLGNPSIDGPNRGDPDINIHPDEPRGGLPEGYFGSPYTSDSITAIVAPTPQRIPSPFPNEPMPGSFPAPKPGAPRPTPSPTPGPASGGWSWTVFEEMARRVMRDTAIRKGKVAERAIRRGVLGPLGGIIGGIIFPNELGDGTITQVPAPPIPAPSIPEPVVTLPAPAPLPSPTVEIPTPWPAPPAPTSSPSPSAPLPQPSPSPAPSGTPAPTSSSSSWPAFPPINVFQGQRSRLTVPRFYTPPLTSTPVVPNVGQLPSPGITNIGPTTSATPTGLPSPSLPGPSFDPGGLTGFNPQVLSSTPPRTPTTTRTRQCHCETKPKRRKKARECIARGNLQWVSGPKKGKPAGSRCISFRS